MKVYDKQMLDAWQRCVEFNEANPIGTAVIYRPVIGSDNGMKETTTQSEAWALPSGQPVVMVHGQSGCVSLDAVEVVEK